MTSGSAIDFPGQPERKRPAHRSTVQPDSTPTAKVTAGVLTGALVTVVLSAAGRFNIELTGEEAAALVTVLAGLAAWWKKSRPGDVDS